MYSLDQEIIKAFPSHFSAVKIKKEREFKTFLEARLYLLVEFKSIVKMPVTEKTIGTIIDSLLAGDKALCQCYEACSLSGYQISAALRWVGNHKEKTIDIHGLALSFVAPRQSALSLHYDKVIQPLISANLVNQAVGEALLSQLAQAIQLPSPTLTAMPRTIFKEAAFKEHEKLSELGQVAIVESRISTVKKESSDRVYAGERIISNPAYENLSQVKYQLHPNEKRIWLLRSDFNIVIGVKNAYQTLWGYHGFHDIFENKSYSYLDWNDRAGHPSLAMPDPECHYEGDVYYAGHLAQRDGYLEVVDNSGRFDRSGLALEQRKLLEAYVALQFQKVFRVEKVVFVPRQTRDTYDADYFELSGFYTDHNVLKKPIEKREYDINAVAGLLNKYQQCVQVSLNKMQ